MPELASNAPRAWRFRDRFYYGTIFPSPDSGVVLNNTTSELLGIFTLATGSTLMALILTFGPISGAHFNPAVTLADASQGGFVRARAPRHSCRPEAVQQPGGCER